MAWVALVGSEAARLTLPKRPGLIHHQVLRPASLVLIPASLVLIPASAVISIASLTLARRSHDLKRRSHPQKGRSHGLISPSLAQGRPSLGRCRPSLAQNPHPCVDADAHINVVARHWAEAAAHIHRDARHTLENAPHISNAKPEHPSPASATHAPGAIVRRPAKQNTRVEAATSQLSLLHRSPCSSRRQEIQTRQLKATRTSRDSALR